MPAPNPELFEGLASFYLGRHYDLKSGNMTDDLLLYDAKDLCTHAMCVGMTGSGKTGLCISLLEEAAIDGVPAICVDPKGDLANLCLTFPNLEPGDFKPWLEASEAARKGMDLDQLAQKTADTWQAGLADWGQSSERIRTLKKAVDVSIYTPGSNIGLPLTVLKSFDAPPPEAREDAELLGDRVTGAVSGLLTLMGIDADPLISPEHILLSSILNHEWKEGRNVGIGQLIRLIQSPPLSRIGVVDLDSFLSPTDRGKLAMRLNNLLASPAFAPWLEGEALSIPSLLYTPEGKPRLSILSIAHLDDTERMFFVTILLNELLAWMRTQMGTSSLRAMFYMDEVAGYFPPVANPPSKPPMLTLLKQARAFGLGITLATQNPVDLDYKGLSNIGTWFLGRLQTERDKARVLEGLEGAANQTGQPFDRAAMEQTLASLGSRVFLMNNVHDGFPSVFHTRWAMSFLAGPLARNQISRLMDKKKSEQAGPTAVETPSKASAEPSRPVVPAGIGEQFLVASRPVAQGAALQYRPALACEGSMHFIRKTAELDFWRDAKLMIPCHAKYPDEGWEASQPVPGDCDQTDDPQDGFSFADLPDPLLSKGKYRSYRAGFKDYLYRSQRETLFKSTLAKEYAPARDRASAIAYFQQLLRGQRDEAIEDLRDKYEQKLKSLEKKMETAQQRIERERAQSRTSMISAGTSIVGALLGGFLGGRRTKMSTVARGVSYASQQGGDVQRAERSLALLEEDRKQLEDDLQQDLNQLRQTYQTDSIELEEIPVPPRKSDLDAGEPFILWLPYGVDASGAALPLF